jgi:hypothetical protein
MSRLIRLDRSGHTTLAEWTAGEELDNGLLASATREGGAEVVRELPLDAELVVMRRPIAGG